MTFSDEFKKAVANYLDGTATPEQSRLVEAWYHAFNDEEVTIAADMPDAAGKLEERLRLRLEHMLGEDRTVPVVPVNARPVWKRIAVAAAVLVLVSLLGILWYTTFYQAVEMVVVKTGKGEIKTVQLPDGSRVWLNAMSELHYPATFDSKQRQVELTGEAFFDIAKQEHAGFRVLAGKLQTEVLGTSFNMKAYQQETDMSVVVLSGKVKVGNEQAGTAVLTAGSGIKYNTTTQKMQPVTVPAMDGMPWVAGKLSFEEESLENITAALSRWYGVTFEFKNPQLKYCNYTGHFPNDITLEKLLELFSTISHVRYEIKDGNSVILSGEECH
ncbi:FecR family protein [Chitinophaga defluvii]|uniref:FecR domain-containing protein n=1 Tax=Chitinophaga defluvii TaxID=3163343 RepID=A0ABV2TBL1_9BACT